MADTKSFDQLKDEIKAKVEKGFILDDDKMADLKEALEKNGNDISKINIKDFCKEEKQEENGNSQTHLTVNDNDDKPAEENTNESSTNSSAGEDNTWKQDYLHDWREWAQNNNLLFEDSNVPTGRFDISFRLYEDEEKKKEKDFAAEISYKGPNNLTLRGPKGKTPDDRFFSQAVAQAMKNGPDIEFGDIKSPEFKAKLMVACYANGANMLKAPSEEEISKWPKELQDMVNKAKTAAENRHPEKTPEKAPEKTPEKTPEKQIDYRQAWSDVLDHKVDKSDEELDLASYSDIKNKAMYFAAAQMAGIKVKNAPTQEELATVTDPKIQEVLNDAKELNTVREKMNNHKTQSPDETMDVSMFNKKMQTLYNIAAIESGVKTSTTLDDSDLFKQPQHLQSSLRRLRNELKLADLRKRGAQDKGVDEKTFEQNRTAERKIRIEAYKAQQNSGR